MFKLCNQWQNTLMPLPFVPELHSCILHSKLYSFSVRYGLMSWCWTTSPSARPSAPQLLAALHDFRQTLSTYI